MRVVIAGPGRIGCGYLAPAFAAAGWDVVLAARTPERAARIRRLGALTAAVTGTDRLEHVRPAGAVAVGEPEFTVAVGEADLVCTSVGVGQVTALAEPLARALAARPEGRPLDVWVVENADCAGALERAVREAAAGTGASLPPVGFAGAVARVAVAHGSWDDPEPTFLGDGARELFVDARRLVTRVPLPPRVETVRDYLPRLHEKLYVFNAGHAICAYLGWLRGHRTVAEAVSDPLLRPMVVGCLLESRRALLVEHPCLGRGVERPVAEALRRFGDAELADPLVRVARDPLRKLSPSDRLLGPVALIRRATGDVPAYLSLALAGALLYRADGDREAAGLAQLLAQQGVLGTLEQVCGLDRGDPLAAAVAARYRGFVFTDEETVFPPAHHAVVDAASGLEAAHGAPA